MKSNYTRRVSAWVRYQTSRLIVRKKNKKMPTTTLNSIIINYYVFVWNKIASLVSTFDRLIDTRDGCDSRIIIIIIKMWISKSLLLLSLLNIWLWYLTTSKEMNQGKEEDSTSSWNKNSHHYWHRKFLQWRSK